MGGRAGESAHALPDPGAVQRMLDTPGDVVYAPYLLRHGWPVLSTWQYINDRNLGMSLSNYRDELERAVRQGGWRICGAEGECEGVGALSAIGQGEELRAIAGGGGGVEPAGVYRAAGGDRGHDAAAGDEERSAGRAPAAAESGED